MLNFVILDCQKGLLEEGSSAIEIISPQPVILVIILNLDFSPILDK